MRNSTALLSILILLSTQIFAQSPVTQGLVAWYPFTGSASDLSGNQLNGTVMGATLTTDRFGNSNAAYHFNAADTQYILVPHDTLLNMSGSVSAAFWVYKTSYGGPDSSTAIMSVFHKGRDVHNSFGFYTVHFTDRFYVRNFGIDGANTDPVSSITLDTWHFVVGVHDMALNEIRLYVDGVLKQTMPGVNYSGNTQHPLVIGRHYKESDGTGGAAFPFDGKIDDLRLYNRVLSHQEILEIYNEPCSGYATLSPDSTVCAGEIVTLTGGGGDSYEWYPPMGAIVNTRDIQVDTDTTILLIAIKHNGCHDTASVHLTVHPESEITVSPDTTICQGKSVTLTASGGIHYTWVPQSGIPPVDSFFVVTPSSSTQYTVSITDSMGCVYERTILVEVEICTGISQAEADGIRVFPVPAKDDIFVEVAAIHPGTWQAVLVDLTGRTVRRDIWAINGGGQQQYFIIPIKGLPPGSYFLQLTHSQGSHLLQVVVHE